nr:MAG TPA: hypothetical protein [Microviridae sp.]
MNEKDKLLRIVRYLLTFWLFLLVFSFILALFTCPLF